jgi:hypothetical protein
LKRINQLAMSAIAPTAKKTDTSQTNTWRNVSANANANVASSTPIASLWSKVQMLLHPQQRPDRLVPDPLHAVAPALPSNATPHRLPSVNH